MENNQHIIKQIYGEFAGQFIKSNVDLAQIDKELAIKMNGRGYAIFNSDPRTTLKRNRVYVMALNPGGGDDSNLYTAENMSFWDGKKLGWNAYYDEFWGKNNTFSQHQINIREVLSRIRGMGLEEACRKTFSTNLHFFKTPGEKELVKYPLDMIDCWKYHEKFLEIVQPEIILCVGNGAFSPFAECYSRFQPGPIAMEKVASRKYVKGFRANGMKVIGVPHLSRPYASMENILKGLEKISQQLK